MEGLLKSFDGLDLTAAIKVGDTDSESADEVPTDPPILLLRTQFFDTN
jgi:hypothetical protein